MRADAHPVIALMASLIAVLVCVQTLREGLLLSELLRLRALLFNTSTLCQRQAKRKVSMSPQGVGMHLSLDMSSSAKQFTMEHVLRSIHYHRCYGYLELVAIINTLPDFITKHNKVVWIGREGENGERAALKCVLTANNHRAVSVTRERGRSVIVLHCLGSRMRAC